MNANPLPLTIDAGTLGDAVKDDFASLWKFTQVGGSVEVSTPYMLPDRSLLTLYITIRDTRFIVCENGTVAEFAEREGLDLSALVNPADFAFGAKATTNPLGVTIFYKDTPHEKSIGSMIFDMAHFCLFLTTSLPKKQWDYLTRESEKCREAVDW